MQTTVTRNIAYDIMRMIAILLVAVQHAWSMLGLDTPECGMVCYAYRAIVDAGVPLFVLISGALLLNETPISFVAFFRKRFTRVLIPFLIWGLVVYVVSCFSHQYETVHSVKDALLCFIPYLLQNRINDFHWFIHMILVLYLLTPILQRALYDQPVSIWLYLIGLWLAIMILSKIYPDLYILKYSSSIIPYLGLYILGGYWARHNVRHQHIYGFVAVVVLYVANVLSHTAWPFLTQLTAFALFMVFSSCSNINPTNGMSRLCIAISRYSYLIYLIHIPIIRALYICLDKVGLTAVKTATITPVWTAIVVVGLISIGCLILDKIPGRFKHDLGVA